MAKARTNKAKRGSQAEGNGQAGTDFSSIIKLLRGTESDILEGGALDYPDAILEKLGTMLPADEKSAATVVLSRARRTLETTPDDGITATEANAVTTTPRIRVRFIPEFNAALAPPGAAPADIAEWSGVRRRF